MKIVKKFFLFTLNHSFKNILYDFKQLIKNLFLTSSFFFKPKKDDKEPYLQELIDNGVLKIKWNDIFNEDIGNNYLFQKINYQASRLIQGKKKDKQIGKNKYVIFGSGNLDLEPDPYLLALGNNSFLIRLVSNYFGSPCYVYSADYWLHKASSDTKRISAQNWHRDPESKKMIKLFLFINEVTLLNGPTEFIKGSHKTSRNFYLRNLYRNLTMAPENFMETLKETNKENIFYSIGNKGEIVFMDTSGFHRGGKCQEDRLIANITYLPYKYNDGIPAWVKN